jgi:hypothetical protein
VTEHQGALSAYVPTSQTARPADDFADPLKHYIVETVALEDRKVRARQLGIVLALVMGIFVSQWPVAFSSANAVTSSVIGADAFGAPTVVLTERLAFAGGLLGSF